MILSRSYMGLAVSFSAILFHFASTTICTRKWYRVDTSQYYSAILHPERKKYASSLQSLIRRWLIPAISLTQTWRTTSLKTSTSQWIHTPTYLPRRPTTPRKREPFSKQNNIRPYKITYLILIHLFPKNWGGRRHFIYFFFYSSGH